ncbi:amidohydrolase [Gilliamella sp. ESL0441]|uniref:amidohydrolase n=1 Tax=Gilliamella sp. ESL0441 TaxID=2704654 RepID=UPI001C69E6B9|nr:amidohydrolase [Gilliamella sp. ESL0441]QYN43801.1 amidohydrolase [Gilliamella sp. ESL0441]
MHQPIAQTIHQLFVTLHQHPELSNQEFETTKILKTYLEKANIKIIELGAKTGVIAEIGTGSPILALRADIDALPIHEQTNCDYRSQNKNVMHACGHDVHASILMGAAYLLKEHEKDLTGTIRLLFQPAEENFSGALQFIKIGALKGVDAILGLHNNPNLTINQMASRAGPFSANVDRIEITITGVGAHAARPESGIDPIVIGAQIVNAIQTISSRSVSGLDAVIVSITKFEGGNTWNVIPEKVEMEGTVRTLTPKIRTKVKQQLASIIENIAIAMGAKAELKWFEGPPSIINVENWVELAKNIARQEGYEIIDFQPQLGGEDFAHYLHHVPGAFINLGSQSPYALHHPKFQINSDMITPAANYLAKLAKQALIQLEQSK